MQHPSLIHSKRIAPPPNLLPSAKPKEEEEEQVAGLALKRTKISKPEGQDSESALEPETGERVPPNRLSRKERRAEQLMKDLAELKRRAEEWKRKIVKPVAKRNKCPRTKTLFSPQSLCRLSAEVREMIFELCDFEWTGRSPALTRTFCQDPQLHAEAMRVFFKKNLMFSLNRRNNWSLREMPVETILTIKKIKIEI